MLVNGLENFTHARHEFKELFAVGGHPVHRAHVTLAQVIDALENVLVSKAFVFESLSDNLQVSHSGHHHLRQVPGGAEDLFEHWDGVILERAATQGMNQRAVDVPEEDAEG